MSLNCEENTRITHEKREEIPDSLCCTLFVHEWEQSYHNPGIPGEVKWTPNIRFTDSRSIKTGGRNSYYYDELKALFKEPGW